MSETKTLPYGYVGKIARVNLTDQSFGTLETSDYAPEFIGGRAIANKIFWDEVEPGVGPFDPDNMLILMTGPTCGTGLPTGDRTAMTGIAANNIPNQYCWGSIGGVLPSRLKYAGFDGVIIEGKADKPSVVIIDDGTVRFESAEDLWGKLVHETQEAIWERYGKDFESLVIGPAGEHLVRIASLTNGNDSAFAKSGFGAVFGSKNLKALIVRGTGIVTPADIDHIMKLRKTAGAPLKKLNPLVYDTEFFHPPAGLTFHIPQGRWGTHIACSPGCNQRCVQLDVDGKSAFPEMYDTATLMNKCIDSSYLMKDCGWAPRRSVHTKKSFVYNCSGLSDTVAQKSPVKRPDSSQTDPIAPCSDAYAADSDEVDPDYVPRLDDARVGNNLNLYDYDYDRYHVTNGLCTELGIDRWDVSVWLIPWLVMGKRVGLLKEEDFDGLSLDPISEDLLHQLLLDIAYRRGRWGSLFAEGVQRALAELGPEYSETEYHFMSSYKEGLELNIPISFASSWGHSFHWQGRGYQGAGDIVQWLPATLKLMINTRDAQTNGHMHMKVDTWLKGFEDTYHNPVIAQITVDSDRDSEYKESVCTCERMTPNPFWPELESELFNAATGLGFTKEELEEHAIRSLLLFRAIEIRNHDRTREMEVKEAWRPLQYPDCEGTTTSWEEFNDLVDVFYDYCGWDRKTGWPTRACYEKYGLGYVADEMETVGKLPDSQD